MNSIVNLKMLTDAVCNKQFNELPLKTKQHIIKIIHSMNAGMIETPKLPADLIGKAQLVHEQSNKLVIAATDNNLYEFWQHSKNTAAIALRMCINFIEL